MISVDTKNRELIGNFKNKGRLWREAVDEVSTYDFRGDAECRAIPYGIYDVAANRGHVWAPRPTRRRLPYVRSGIGGSGRAERAIRRPRNC